MEPKSCSKCKYIISDSFYFCPNCGKKLKEPPVSTTVLRQIYIYSLSILLPPLGLWPAVKYLRQKDRKAKIIGIVAIILTIISSIITTYLTINILNSEITAINNSQSQDLRSLGY